MVEYFCGKEQNPGYTMCSPKSMRANSAIEKRGFLQRNVQIQMFGSAETSFGLVLKYGVNQECLINGDECCSCLLGLPNGGQTLKRP